MRMAFATLRSSIVRATARRGRLAVAEGLAVQIARMRTAVTAVSPNEVPEALRNSGVLPVGVDLDLSA